MSFALVPLNTIIIWIRIVLCCPTLVKIDKAKVN